MTISSYTFYFQFTAADILRLHAYDLAGIVSFLRFVYTVDQYPDFGIVMLHLIALHQLALRFGWVPAPFTWQYHFAFWQKETSLRMYVYITYVILVFISLSLSLCLSVSVCLSVWLSFWNTIPTQINHLYASKHSSTNGSGAVCYK